MKHRFGYRKLNRSSDHRRAMLRSLATSMIESGRIVTTVERAKELRRVVERLVTLSKEDSVFHRRRARSYLFTDASVVRLFTYIKEANLTRPGGYTRIVHMGYRPGDNARRAIIEFVETSCLNVKQA